MIVDDAIRAGDMFFMTFKGNKSHETYIKVIYAIQQEHGKRKRFFMQRFITSSSAEFQNINDPARWTYEPQISLLWKKI